MNSVLLLLFLLLSDWGVQMRHLLGHPGQAGMPQRPLGVDGAFWGDGRLVWELGRPNATPLGASRAARGAPETLARGRGLFLGGGK